MTRLAAPWPTSDAKQLASRRAGLASLASLLRAARKSGHVDAVRVRGPRPRLRRRLDGRGTERLLASHHAERLARAGWRPGNGLPYPLGVRRGRGAAAAGTAGDAGAALSAQRGRLLAARA